MIILCGKYPPSVYCNVVAVNIFEEASGLIDQINKIATPVIVVVDFSNVIFGIEYLTMFKIAEYLNLIWVEKLYYFSPPKSAKHFKDE